MPRRGAVLFNRRNLKSRTKNILGKSALGMNTPIHIINWIFPPKFSLAQYSIYICMYSFGHSYLGHFFPQSFLPLTPTLFFWGWGSQRHPVLISLLTFFSNNPLSSTTLLTGTTRIFFLHRATAPKQWPPTSRLYGSFIVQDPILRLRFTYNASFEKNYNATNSLAHF
jgi:hypothetical protein